jgi:hypothetical protein
MSVVCGPAIPWHGIGVFAVLALSLDRVEVFIGQIRNPAAAFAVPASDRSEFWSATA